MKASKDIIGNNNEKDFYKQGCLSIFIETTDRCNLNCLYCYAKPNKSFLKKDPTYNHFKKIVSRCNEIKDRKYFYELSGGEFLLRPDWEDICELFLSTGKEVYLYSNATLINDDIAERIGKLSKKYGDKFLFCSSLDSHIPKINDATRGKYDLVINGFNLLRSRGVKLKVYVMLTSYNLSTIYETIDFLSKNYSKEIMLSCIRPVFKMNEKNRKLLIPYNQFLEIARKLTEKAKEEGWNFYSTLGADGKLICGAGEDRLFINTTGDITPCYCLREKEDVLASIYSDPSEEIFNKLKKFNVGRDKNILLCEHLNNRFGEPSVKLENG